jgi:hypothetical protein
MKLPRRWPKNGAKRNAVSGKNPSTDAVSCRSAREARRERVESNDSAGAEDEAAGAGNACTSDKHSTRAKHYRE